MNPFQPFSPTLPTKIVPSCERKVRALRSSPTSYTFLRCLYTKKQYYLQIMSNIIKNIPQNATDSTKYVVVWGHQFNPISIWGNKDGKLNVKNSIKCARIVCAQDERIQNVSECDFPYKWQKCSGSNTVRLDCVIRSGKNFAFKTNNSEVQID